MLGRVWGTTKLLIEMLWVDVTLFDKSSSGEGERASFNNGDGVRGMTVEVTLSTLTAADPPMELVVDC